MLPPPPLDLKLVGSPSFIATLLTHIRAAHAFNFLSPGLPPPLDTVIFQSILLCLIAREKHLVLRTPEEDVGLAVKLVVWTLSHAFNLETHKVKIKTSSRARGSSQGTRTSSTAKAEAQFRSEAGAAERFLKSLLISSASSNAGLEQKTDITTNGDSPEESSGSSPTNTTEKRHEYARSRSFPQHLNLSVAETTSIAPSTSTSTSTSTIIRPQPTYAYRPSQPQAYTYPVNATPSSASVDTATPTTASATTPTAILPPAIGRHPPTLRLPHAYTDPLPLPLPYRPKSRTHAKTRSKGSSHSRHKHSKSRSQSRAWHDAEGLEGEDGAGGGGPEWRAEDMHLPQALVLSGLEHASEGAQRALGRVLSERKVVLPVKGEEDEERTWDVPEEFIVVYVCPWNARERPAVHTSLLDKFAMSTNVFIPQNVRHDYRLLQFASSSTFPPGYNPAYSSPRSHGHPQPYPHLHVHTRTHSHGYSRSNPGSPSLSPSVPLPPTHTPPMRTSALPAHSHSQGPGYGHGHTSTSTGSFSPASPLGYGGWRPASVAGGSPSAYNNYNNGFASAGGYDRHSYTYTQPYGHPYPSPSDRDTLASPFFASLPPPSALPPMSPSSPLADAGPTPPSSPLLPVGLLAALRTLSKQHTHLSPSLSLYLSDLFSAARHHPRLDGMLLGARAMRDADALVRAGRVVGIGGAEAGVGVRLGNGSGGKKGRRRKDDADESEDSEEEEEEEEEGNGDGDGGGYGYTSTGESSQSDVHRFIGNANQNLDPSRTLSPPRSPRSPAGPNQQPPVGSGKPTSGPDPAPILLNLNLKSLPPLDISEVDIARIVPRVISHRVRVRDGPREEVLSGVLFGATFGPGSGWGFADGEKGVDGVDGGGGRLAGHDRETVKSVLVQILSEV